MVNRTILCDMDLSPSHRLFVQSKYKGTSPTWLLDI